MHRPGEGSGPQSVDGRHHEMATEELEDFKTTELAKVKADFQAKA